MADGLWLFASCIRTELQTGWRSHVALVAGVVQPAVFAFLALGSGNADSAEATRLFVAVTLTSLWGVSVWNAGGILRRERLQGTLASILTGPHPPFLVILGKCAGATVGSASVVLLSTTGTAAALRSPIALGKPVWLAVGVAVVLISGTALGMLVSCASILTRHGPALSSALTYPVFILGGLLIPPALLPLGLSWAPAGFSLSWAGSFITSTATSDPDFTALLVAVALTAGYYGAAGYALARVVDRARRRNTLEVG